jgi:hypothetical protein
MRGVSCDIGHFSDEPADVPYTVAEESSHHVLVVTFSDLFHVSMDNIIQNAMNGLGAG